MQSHEFGEGRDTCKGGVSGPMSQCSSSVFFSASVFRSASEATGLIALWALSYLYSEDQILQLPQLIRERSRLPAMYLGYLSSGSAHHQSLDLRSRIYRQRPTEKTQHKGMKSSLREQSIRRTIRLISTVSITLLSPHLIASPIGSW